MNDKHSILSTVSLFHGFNDGSLAVIPLLFPILKEMFNLSYTQIGFITGGGLAISLFTEIAVGRAFDSNNSRTLLISGVLILSGSMFMLSLSQNFFTLVLLVFLIRFSSSFFHPVGIGLISRIFKKDRLDWAMGIQSAFGDFGAFIAILTTLFIAVSLGWIFPLYIWSILGLVCLFIGLYLTRYTPKKLLIVGVLKNKKQTVSEAIVEWFFIIKRFRLLIPLFVVSSLSYGLTISYLPLFLDEKTNLTLSSIGLIISLWVGIGVIACLFYGKIQSYIRRKTIITLSYIIIGLMSLLLTISTSIHIIVIIVILLGLSTFLSFPALFSFVSEATHQTVEGKTFGYIFTIQLGFGTVVLFLSGLLADIFGIWIPFALLGVSSLFATIMIFFKCKFLYVYN
ncbi:MAG: MFS transporter [Candidatus Thermoplasmatota archaeon]|nr:MFS transporter [Candidatus Thermoplasmatota archaeon]